ncbi:MAG: thioether cross-link-forming SCIFF peptide maturase [Bacillota bacterium]|jgi:uncharacterized protein
MVHLFEKNGFHIVIDGNSGAVHDVDEVARDIIAAYPHKGKEEITAEITKKYGDVTADDVHEVFEEIEELKKRGLLFSEDRFRGVAAKLREKEPVIKALCLHVAHSCNLACEYCFAGQGRYDGEQALMSFETGRRALDFLLEHSGSRRNLEVDFFGGEPLVNFDVVRELTAYARSVEKERGKNFRFTLTTNGLLIDDDVIDFCNREMSNVVLSLDGRKEVNDRFRRTVNGKGSYDLILPKFKRLVEKRGGKNYYMRGTYTKANTDFVSDILHMADLGFTELSMEPVISAPDEPYALGEEELPVLLRQYDLLGEEMDRRRKAGRPFTFYHYMIDLQGGPCIVKRVAGCGVGTEYMAVTPEGDLYPCHQFVGDPSFRLGDVFHGIDNEALRERFRGRDVYAHAECDDCFARFFCSGGCAANAYHATGDLNGVYRYGCELHRRRVENAVMLKVSEARDARAAENGGGE